MKVRPVILAALAAALGLSASARATVLRPMPLAEVAEASEVVFVGTVRETTTVPGGPPYDLLMTEVTFEDLVVLRGEVPTAEARYRFAGGRLGRRRVVAVGVPRFTPGERVVLFASREGRISNAVGFTAGVYRVGREPSGGEEIVLDAFGRPVLDFVDGFPVRADSGAAAMRLAEFAALVRSLGAEDGGASVEPEEDR